MKSCRRKNSKGRAPLLPPERGATSTKGDSEHDEHSLIMEINAKKIIDKRISNAIQTALQSQLGILIHNIIESLLHVFRSQFFHYPAIREKKNCTKAQLSSMEFQTWNGPTIAEFTDLYNRQ